MANSIATAWITVKPSTEGMMNSLGNDFKAMGGNLENQGSTLANKFAAKFGIVAELAGKAAGAATTLVSDAIGAAVSRSDTMLQFSRTFENLGFSAQQTKDTIDSVSDSIKGLPTRLDDAAQSVTFLTSSMDNDPKQATKMFAALNDAVLGFGGTATDAARITRLLGEAFTGGRVDARRWNEMLNAGMGPALNMVAEKMHITSDELKKGMGQGKISAKEFQDALIDLDQHGVGSMKSLHDIALDSTKGIGTSFVNMQTAISRGLASIIDGLRDSGVDIAGAIKEIGNAFEGAEKWVAQLITSEDAKRIIDAAKDIFSTMKKDFNALVGNIDLSSIVNSFKTMVGALKSEVQPLAQIFKTLSGSGVKGEEVFKRTGQAITELAKVASVAIPAIAGAFAGLKLGGLLQGIGIGILNVGEAFKVAGELAKEGSIEVGVFRGALQLLDTGTLSGFTGAVKTAFTSLGEFILANPVGVALAAIGAVTGVFLYMKNKADEAKDAQDRLRQSVRDTMGVFQQWEQDNNKDVALEQAQLNADNAERSLKKLTEIAEEAKKQYGENSDQYVEALANQKQAELDVTTTKDALNHAQEEHNKVIEDAKNKTKELGDQYVKIGGDAGVAQQSQDDLNNAINNSDYSGGKEAMDNLSTHFDTKMEENKKTAQETADDIRNSIMTGAPTEAELDAYIQAGEKIKKIFKKVAENIGKFFSDLWQNITNASNNDIQSQHFSTQISDLGFTPDWATPSSTAQITPFATGINQMKASLRQQQPQQEFPKKITLVDSNGSIIGRMKTIAEMAVA